MILYDTDHGNLPLINISTYNINHGDNFDNSNNSILRETLKKLIFRSNIPHMIFLQECTQDILDYLRDLEDENNYVTVVNSKKIINGNVRIYENYEYFIFVLYSPPSPLTIKNINHMTISLDILDILNDKEKATIINNSKQNGFLYRKLLDSKKIILQNITLDIAHNEKSQSIDFYNVHLTSKPNLNYLHSYILNKFMMTMKSSHKVLLGDFNNVFNSYSLNILKESKQNDIIIKSKSSKLRNINKVIKNDSKYSNATDFLYNTENHKEYSKKCIDHILFEDFMRLISYENDMDVDYQDMNPSDHFYVKATFELQI
ncbi:hypothetical protein ACO0R3_002414 [Hanseniaspora guilliermondii]